MGHPRTVPARRLTSEQQELVTKWRFLPCYWVSRSPGYRRVLGAEEADSVAYLALVQAATLYDAGRGVQFTTYASRAILNALYAAARGRQARWERECVYATDPEKLTRVLGRAEEELDDTAIVVRKLMDDVLDQRLRGIVEMRYQREMNTGQIAALLCVSRQAVQVALKVAVQRMRKAIAADPSRWRGLLDWNEGVTHEGHHGRRE